MSFFARLVMISVTTVVQICISCTIVFAQNSSNVFGFTQIRLNYNLQENKSPNNELEINKLRVGFETSLTKKLGLFFLTEGGAVAPNGSQTFSLLDAYVSYQLNKYVNIRIGQDWYKFGWEYTQPIPTLPFINFSEVVSVLFDNMGRNGFYGYDIGIWINGETKNNRIPIGYNLAITNGTGLNKKEDNNIKDISLRFYAVPYNKIHAGISIFKGASTISKENLDEYLFDLEARYLGKKITIGTEYVYGFYKQSEQNPMDLLESNKRGFYVYFDYKFFNRLNLLARFENNKALLKDDFRTNIITLGITYSFSQRNNLKINFIHQNNTTINVVDRYIITQLQVFFDSERGK